MYPYGLQDKKSLNMRILEILEQYSEALCQELRENFFKKIYAVLDRRAWRALLFSRNMMRRRKFVILRKP